MAHLVVVLSCYGTDDVARLLDVARSESTNATIVIASVFARGVLDRDARKFVRDECRARGMVDPDIYRLNESVSTSKLLAEMNRSRMIEEERAIVVRDDTPGAEHVLMSDFTLNHMFGLWDALDDMPSTMKHHKQTASDRCTDFASRMYDASAIQRLMGDTLWAEVSLLKRKVLIADLARYYLMWQRGGLYLDLDVLVKQDMRPLIQSLVRHNVDVLLFTEHDACPTVMLGPRENPAHTKRIYNCMFWSRPNHPIWKRCFDLALERCRALSPEGDRTWSDTDVIWATGPDVITTVWNESFADDPQVRVMSNEDTVRYLVHTHAGTWRNGRDVRS